ncbi:MAG: indole-3-glycerol phosphate synthase TrpC [Proteobacteria bacterium]|nr:indole-3-glycerol phosphate synthase TrpC [Pseudomonadota bacterium]
MTTPTVLEKIVKEKKIHVEERRRRMPLTTHNLDRPSPPRGFAAALKAQRKLNQPSVIAEIKKGSPSKGVIRPEFDVAEIASAYDRAGATCLSCLTDKPFFYGDDQDLMLARQHSRVPVLRKDFIVDAYQILESYQLGADCILLIAAILDDDELSAFFDQASALGMDALIEVHNAEECRRALTLGPKLLGINNRNLHDFSVSLTTTIDLLPFIPTETQVVTESGIHTRDDVELMLKAGVSTFLVGEAFMRAPDPGEKLKALF